MNRSNQWRREMFRERIENLAPEYDPAHVEAWMRVLFPVIDALLPLDFVKAVVSAERLIDAAGLESSDAVAARFDLRPRKRKPEIVKGDSA